MSVQMAAVCNAEIDSLLQKKAVVEIFDDSPGFVCSFFCIPKSGEGLFRPIVNLRPLNKCIRYEHFKMENLNSVRSLLREGDFMVKVDLKDAYFLVGVREYLCKFLRFSWNGRIFEFRCMAFGLAPAPRVFTKFMKVVVASLRKKGIRLVIYLDDLLFFSKTRKGGLSDLSTAISLLKSLGFVINWKKSVATPTQIIEYLGIVVNSMEMSFALPEKRIILVQDMCKKALVADTVSLRTIASILGNFNWAIPTIPFAQSHYRSMQRFYIGECRKAQGNFFNSSGLAHSRQS